MDTEQFIRDHYPDLFEFLQSSLRGTFKIEKDGEKIDIKFSDEVDAMYCYMRFCSGDSPKE